MIMPHPFCTVWKNKVSGTIKYIDELKDVAKAMADYYNSVCRSDLHGFSPDILYEIETGEKNPGVEVRVVGEKNPGEERRPRGHKRLPELSIWDSDECAWFSKGGEPLEIITDYSTEAETQAGQGVFIVREKEGMHTCNAQFCNRRTNKYLLGPMNRKYYYCWEHYYEYKKKLTVLREPYADDAQ